MLVVKATAAINPTAIAAASQASTFSRLAASSTGLNAGLILFESRARIRLNIFSLWRAFAHYHGHNFLFSRLILGTRTQ